MPQQAPWRQSLEPLADKPRPRPEDYVGWSEEFLHQTAQAQAPVLAGLLAESPWLQPPRAPHQDGPTYATLALGLG